MVASRQVDLEPVAASGHRPTSQVAVSVDTSVRACRRGGLVDRGGGMSVDKAAIWTFPGEAEAGSGSCLD